MTLLRHYEPTDSALARWVRDVRAILTRGLRWSDQIGPLVTLRYSGSGAPYEVAVATQPLAVLCLAATKRGDPSRTESGARVVWSWAGGRLRIHAVGLTSAVDEYDVTLGTLQG